MEFLVPGARDPMQFLSFRLVRCEGQVPGCLVTGLAYAGKVTNIEKILSEFTAMVDKPKGYPSVE